VTLRARIALQENSGGDGNEDFYTFATPQDSGAWLALQLASLNKHLCDSDPETMGSEGKPPGWIANSPAVGIVSGVGLGV
jgi:hypothetical protein